MEKKIRLIWDFRGPAAARTAAHFAEHLRESPLYTPGLEAGVEQRGELHSLAYLIVEAAEMPRFRDALKPHRGEYATPQTPDR
jgi:hypothetical protein